MEFEVQNTETSCQLVAGEKPQRMLGGSSRTLANQIMDTSLKLEARKIMSEQGRSAGGDG